jgi:hypothetical protein
MQGARSIGCQLANHPSQGDATMTQLNTRSVTPGLERGNVSAIVGMLNGILELVADDEIMEDVANTLENAIRQLTTLQQVAYHIMLEAEAEREISLRQRSLTTKKPH